MPKLAMWGAVAGGAQGYQKHLENEFKRELVDADAAREERLLKLKQSHDVNLAKRRETHDVALAERRETHDLNLEDTRQGGRVELAEVDRETRLDQEALRQSYMTGRAIEDRRHKESEGDLDRESREKIARIQTAGSSSSARKALTRFEARTLTTSEATDLGLPIEVDTPGVFDKLSATWYLQEGDVLRFPGEKEPKKRASDRAVEALYLEPERAPEFYFKYKFLPIGYLGVLNEAALSAPAAPQ